MHIWEKCSSHTLQISKNEQQIILKQQIIVNVCYMMIQKMKEEITKSDQFKKYDFNCKFEYK